jgi:hypothetical protein
MTEPHIFTVESWSSLLRRHLTRGIGWSEKVLQASCSIYWTRREESHMTVLHCSDYPYFRVGAARVGKFDE